MRNRCHVSVDTFTSLLESNMRSDQEAITKFHILSRPPALLFAYWVVIPRGISVVDGVVILSKQLSCAASG